MGLPPGGQPGGGPGGVDAAQLRHRHMPESDERRGHDGERGQRQRSLGGDGPAVAHSQTARARLMMPRSRPRTSPLRTMARSSPAKPQAATVTTAYSAVAMPRS